jgi:hypothetical protein
MASDFDKLISNLNAMMKKEALSEQELRQVATAFARLCEADETGESFQEEGQLSMMALEQFRLRNFAASINAIKLIRLRIEKLAMFL